MLGERVSILLAGKSLAEWADGHTLRHQQKCVQSPNGWENGEDISCVENE